MTQYGLPDEVLEHLQAGTLFYPSAGCDISTPIEVFSSWLSEFWFVDTEYTGRRPLLENNTDYELVGNQKESVSGETLVKHKPFKIEVYQETYERKRDQRRITVYQCKGRGYDTFRTLLKSRKIQLSVFFYRGDSSGGGGSGFYWLRKARLKNILEVLEDYGLIVSDGSNGTRRSNATRELSTFHHRLGVAGNVAQERVQPFTFAKGRFECIGYLDEKYGPTLVWQVKRISPSSPDT